MREVAAAGGRKRNNVRDLPSVDYLTTAQRSNNHLRQLPLIVRRPDWHQRIEPPHKLIAKLPLHRHARRHGGFEINDCPNPADSAATIAALLDTSIVRAGTT